jgi:hypothetical protein
MREPFVGLRPFDRDDDDIFFGRLRHTKVLANLVLTLPIVVVYATSGTGKSSLLRAGLIKELVEKGADPVYSAEPGEDIQGLLERGFEVPHGPALDIFGAFETYRARRNRRPVLILDQFEERLKHSDQMLALWEALARLAHSRKTPGTVVISIRDDFLGGLDGLFQRVPGVMDGSYHVPRLSEDALVEAVIKPLQVAGGGITVSTETIAEVMTGLRAESSAPASNQVEAGYFQIVWQRLWEQARESGAAEITIESYHEIGAAKGIIAEFVDSTTAHLLPFETELLVGALRYLILPSGAKSALKIVDLTDYIREDDLGPIGKLLGTGLLLPSLRPLLNALTATSSPLFRRVSRKKPGNGTPVDDYEYELMHDLLGPIMIEWRQRYIERSGTRFLDRIEHYTQSISLSFRDLERNTEDQLPLLRERSREAFTAIARSVIDGEPGAAYPLEQYAANFAFELLFQRESDLAQFGWIGVRFVDHIRGLASRPDGSPVITRAAQDAYIDALAAMRAAGRRDSLNMQPARRQRPNLAALFDSTVEFVLTAIPAAALAGAGVAIGWEAVLRTFGSGNVAYAPLSLVVLALVSTLFYGVIISDGNRNSRIDVRAVVEAIVPYLEESRERRERGEEAGAGKIFWELTATWPLPMAAVIGIARAGAALFSWLGYSATAGFNLLGLVGTIGIVIYLEIAFD